MLKFLLILALIAVGLFILACLAVVFLMIYIVVTTPKEGDVPTVRYRTGEIAPAPDGTLFRRLSDEARAYASRPFVSTFLDATAGTLRSTVSDRFNKRSYVVSNRRVGKTLNTSIQVYEDGRSEPVASAEVEVPVSQVDWSAYHAELKEVADNGSTMIFNEGDGRAWRIRFPKMRGRHHA